MKTLGITFAFATLVFLISICNEKQPQIDVPSAKKVTAIYETQPVESELEEDAADDPAIYIHPDGAEKSWVIGTDKKSGLHIYNLKGENLHFAKVGLVNNVDVRYGFTLADNSKIDLVAASNRSNNSITILKINASDTTFEPILKEEIISSVDEVYGFCMYHNPIENTFYAIVNGKDGNIEQWLLSPTADMRIVGRKVKSYKVATQPEGMVADDQNHVLYVGEEDKGIWRINLLTNEAPVLLQNSSTDNPNIAFDIEGLALFAGSAPTSGYLIASSQGNFSYAIFERMPPNKYVGSFQVVDSHTLDGTQETDGIEVLNYPLNDDFRHGIFIAQDGFNFDGETLSTQNFKLVKWEDIAKSFTPPLLIE